MAYDYTGRAVCRALILIMAIAALMGFGAACAEGAEGEACGENLVWTLDSQNVLTVSGTGPMYDFDPEPPWGASVVRAVIGDGVTGIGDRAFLNCADLISVTIPDTVTRVGDFAFNSCAALPQVTIPDGVTSVGQDAFTGCGAVRYAGLGSDAAKALSRAGLAFRRPGAVYDLRYIYTDDEITDLQLENADADVTEVTIAEDVTVIGYSAFSQRAGLTAVSMPDSVTHISDFAFNGCAALPEIAIPESVTDIGRYAFAGCAALSAVTLPDGVTSVGTWAFSPDDTTVYAAFGSDAAKALGRAGFSFRKPGAVYDLRYLFTDDAVTGLELVGADADVTELAIAEEVTVIGRGALQEREALTRLTVPDSVTRIEDFAFFRCSNLASLSRLDSVTYVGLNAFNGCSAAYYAALDSVGARTLSRAGLSFRVPDQNGDLKYLYDGDEETGLELRGMHDAEITDFSIPRGVTAVGWAALSGCAALTHVEIPDTVTAIGDIAFMGCGSLAEIAIPDSVTSIGAKAFQSCQALETVTLSRGLVQLGESAFSDCWSLRSISIPGGVAMVPPKAFKECSALADVTLASGVLGIGDEAFMYCEDLETVALPDDLTSIGKSAFEYCRALSELTLPKSLVSVGEYAFSGCTGLSAVTIPDGVTALGANAFVYGLILYANLDTAGARSVSRAGRSFRVAEQNADFRYLFSGEDVTGLQLTGLADRTVASFRIPDGVTDVGGWAFDSCGNLISLTLPDGVVSIGNYAFIRCGSLAYILIPESVATIGADPLIEAGFEGSVYCYEGSAAEAWATGQGYRVVRLDDVDVDECRLVTLPQAVRLPCGGTLRLTADVFPWIDHPDDVWESADPEIISAADGLLTAFAPGTTVVTAHIAGQTVTLTAESFPTIESFDLPEEIWLDAGTSVTVAPTNILPEGADGEFRWHCRYSPAATMYSQGLVTGNKPGDMTLTVTDRITGFSRTTLVHVYYLVTDVAVRPETLSLPSGKTVLLDVVVSTQALTDVDEPVTFTSSDEDVAAVADDGTVVTKGLGTAVITAVTAGGVCGTCEVTVREPFVLALPAGLTEIADEAFMGDLRLETVVVPEGCLRIGARAFAGCENLTRVTLPAGLTDVAADAFEGCGDVTTERAGGDDPL